MVMAWYKVVTPDHATITMRIIAPSDTMVQALDISGPLQTNKRNEAGCHRGNRLLSEDFAFRLFN